MAEPTEKQKPEITFRCGRVDVAVWANEKRTESGETITQHSVTLRKSFKPDPNVAQWVEHRITLFPDEIHDVVLVLEEAERKLRLTFKC